MDYELAYKKSLKVAKNWMKSGDVAESTKKCLLLIFPELEESEDERIREAIKGAIHTATMDEKTREEALSWLEKQKDINCLACDQHLKGYLAGRKVTKEEEQKEQKPAEKQDYSGFNDLERAIHRGFLCAGVENVPVGIIKDTAQDCLAHIKPAEWSEEDSRILYNVIAYVGYAAGQRGVRDDEFKEANDWLKSLRPQLKQESEPVEIKYAGKIYKLYGTKELPGGVVGYIIEDEPGHFDCIIHPEEVLGGGYGIKSNGSPYPTKEANFGQPHWKPSEEQLSILGKVFAGCELNTTERDSMVDLFYHLKDMI